MLTKNEFEVLAYLDLYPRIGLSKLREKVKINYYRLKNIYSSLEKSSFIENGQLTNIAYDNLKPYKVNNAIIMAAGFGSRLAPVTLDTPKPLIKVHEKRMIETIIDELVKKEIYDITIVVGYKKEQFYKLKEKYPFLKFCENNDYNKANNISTMFYARNDLKGTYIFEADLFIKNPDIIRRYEYESNYLSIENSNLIDEWYYKLKNGYIYDAIKNFKSSHQMLGISYFTYEDCIKLRKDLYEAYTNGYNDYWDFVAFRLKRDNYKIAIRKFKPTDIKEIDTFDDLVNEDSSYENYVGEKYE